MKNKLFKVLFLFFVIFMITACATYRVMYYEKAVGKLENIALISTMIGKPNLSPFPLLDAAIYNAKIKSKADAIIQIKKSVIDKYREIVASQLENKLHVEVKHGSHLHSMSEYTELMKNFNFPDALYTGDENFSEIIIASGDINPFKFDEGDVIAFFKEEVNYRDTIAKIAKRLDTNLVAVSYSFLSADANVLGIFGQIGLWTHLYVFNREGELVFSGYSWSIPVTTSGTNMVHYRQILDLLPSTLDPVVDEIANKIRR